MTDTNSKAQVTDAMVEAGARAMCEAWHYARIGTPDGNAEWKGKQAQYRKQSRAAISAAFAAQEKPEPGVAVAGYRRRLPQYAFEHYEFEQPDYANPNIADWEPLYLHPAPSLDLPEGEVEPLDFEGNPMGWRLSLVKFPTTPPVFAAVNHLATVQPSEQEAQEADKFRLWENGNASQWAGNVVAYAINGDEMPDWEFIRSIPYKEVGLLDDMETLFPEVAPSSPIAKGSAAIRSLGKEGSGE